MRQHNTSTSGSSRNCWQTAREKKRMKARFAIRQRVMIAAKGGDDGEKGAGLLLKSQPSTSGSTSLGNCQRQHLEQNASATNHKKQSEEISNDRDASSLFFFPRSRVEPFLRAIIDGNRSLFSVTCMHKHCRLLSAPFPTSYLFQLSSKATEALANGSDSIAALADENDNLQEKNNELLLLLGEQKITSWFGIDGTRRFKDFLGGLQTCTMTEYAIWLQRYFITGQLLLGGINPCVRGKIRNLVLNNENEEDGCNGEGREKGEEFCSDNNNHDKILLAGCCQQQLPWEKELHDIGASVLCHFFDGCVPLALSSFIVKRVVDMRHSDGRYDNDGKNSIGSTITKHQTEQQQTQRTASTFYCSLCQHQKPIDSRLCFDDSWIDNINNSNTSSTMCQHLFCEPCFWRDLLAHLEGEIHGDAVVACPVCRRQRQQEANLTNNDQKHHQPATTTTIHLASSSPTKDEGPLAPSARCQKSLEKYQALPKDSKELKQLSKRKKHKVRERKSLASTWALAVLPSLGASQDVRRDKFAAYVDKGSFHYVKGCLVAGVNVHFCNEYGQTPLYVATWKGYEKLVELLLWYGSDPQIAAHGGSTCLDVAIRNGHDSIVELLHRHMAISACNDDVLVEKVNRMPGDTTRKDWKNDLENSISCEDITFIYSPALSAVIPIDVNHPGAGSYVINNVLANPTVDVLIDLWKSLPIEESSKKTNSDSLCSVRSYFCDSERYISSLLERALLATWRWERDRLSVLPHMRFLSYTKPGSVLAPHVDLCRVDPFSGKRSTHSFLLYLTDCVHGGATALLSSLAGEGRNEVVARVQPRRNRLLLFPHNCPHKGEQVIDVPKLVIRGEVRLA